MNGCWPWNGGLRGGLTMCIVAAAGLRVSGVPDGERSHTQDWSHYQIIVDREPFGRVPKASDPDASDANGTEAAVPVETGPGLAETIRLSVVSLFEGVPAAGFTDSTSGRSYYLFEGQSIDEFTLMSVDAENGWAILRKNQQEATLRLGDVGVSAAPAPPAVSAAPAAPRTVATDDTLSYAERQRRRVEEARARAEEARRQREEEARKSQAENVERLTGEALQRHLRDLNMQIIRSGQSAPLPIELTPQEVAQLAAEGFDVTVPPGTQPEAEVAGLPRIRRDATVPEAE